MLGSHGQFVWYELSTTDMDATRSFYTEVVGWGARDASMPGMPYTVFTAGEGATGGLRKLPQQATQSGERPAWIGYVSVNDVDAAAARIKQMGGAVHMEPRNVLDVSRFSVVADPQTATFALFRLLKAGHDQPASLHTRGHVGWHELFADDGEKAWAFYSELFGWQLAETNKGASGAYQMFSVAGQMTGGIFTKPPTMPAASWMYYFNVGDINAAAARVRAASGKILSGPVEVTGGSWTVQCVDPQGAIFALIGNNGIGYFERVSSSREGQRVK